jgi:hypothetical protein
VAGRVDEKTFPGETADVAAAALNVDYLPSTICSTHNNEQNARSFRTPSNVCCVPNIRVLALYARQTRNSSSELDRSMTAAVGAASGCIDGCRQR